jgi:hypothetical protein
MWNSGSGFFPITDPRFRGQKSTKNTGSRICNTVPTPLSSYDLKYGVLETPKKNFGWNQNQPKQGLFRLCFGLFWFVLVCFGLFWCFETYIKTTKTNRTVSKQTETTLNFLKIPKYALYETVSVGLLFVSFQLKH